MTLAETTPAPFHAGAACPIHPDRVLESHAYVVERVSAGRQLRLYCPGPGKRFSGHVLCRRAGCTESVGRGQTFCSSRCRLIAWRALKRATSAGESAPVSGGDAGDGLGVLNGEL
jgi:hypothetical protein